MRLLLLLLLLVVEVGYVVACEGWVLVMMLMIVRKMVVEVMVKLKNYDQLQE